MKDGKINRSSYQTKEGKTEEWRRRKSNGRLINVRPDREKENSRRRVEGGEQDKAALLFS